MLPLEPLPITPFPSNDVSISSYRALYARSVVRDYFKTIPQETLGRLSTLPVEPIQPLVSESIQAADQDAGGGEIKVGIIGAGAAGLYAAMILDWLGPESGFTYEILEADPVRVGGRLYTHKFPKGEVNDYYDIGAMRFPKIPFMDRTFNLFTRLKVDPIDYVMTLPQNINLFNGILLTNKQLKDAGPDPFKTGVEGINNSADEMTSAQIGDFVSALAKNFNTGWKELMKYDSYSTRSYMIFHGTKGVKYTDQVVNYLETFETATSLYSQALSESVMDSLDFDFPMPPGKEVQWKCIQGGMSQIANMMVKKLKHSSPLLGKRVSAIGFTTACDAMEVSVVGESKPRTYNHVITTVPFSCLRAIDTTGCQLSWTLQTAIRTLHYDTATKVAMQFSRRWWEDTKPKHNQRGGVSSTDRPTRTVVYPSYGIGSDTGASIIVSYTWAQDAARLGALAQGKNSSAEKQLVDLILEDLAVMHGETKKALQDMLVDYHAFDWYNHENSAGAYALFGPGQFTSLFPEVTRPHRGLLHFAGEATSVHHAWVVGALNSAFRTVQEILEYYGKHELVDKIKKEFPGEDELGDAEVQLQVKLGQAERLAEAQRLRR